MARAVLRVLALGALMLCAQATVTELCPHGCSGQGACSPGPVGRCVCFPGFAGPDCSLRVCPAAKAWVDIPSQNNVAHAPHTECSNKGSCDRTTGLCTCYAGFTGPACERNLCPIGLRPETNKTATPTYATCSGRGRCVSLRQASIYQDFQTFRGNEEYTAWDADRIFGCICEPGFEGPNCALVSCPKGDDPGTLAQYAVQLVDCECSTCAGQLQLSYGGLMALPVSHDAAPGLVQRMLRRLPGLRDVTVSALQGTKLCSSTGSVFAVTFVAVADPPVMTVSVHSGSLVAELGVRANGYSSLVSPYLRSRVAQGVESEECSAHGICDYSKGVCHCFSGYLSSDGQGASGSRGDCGYMRNQTTSYRGSQNVTEVVCRRLDKPTIRDCGAALMQTSACAVRSGQVCSGHGFCDLHHHQCRCDSGYDGFDCSRVACPVTSMWFGVVGGDHSNSAPCAGVGTCDVSSGKCTDCGVFGGDSCEILPCPSDASSRMCGGNGTCMTLRQLAGYNWDDRKSLRALTYSAPWDADRIQGCFCYRAVAVDNQFPIGVASFLDATSFNATNFMRNISHDFTSDQDLTRYYRGPFARASTDFAGFDCGEMLCPKGDDPRTLSVNEVQAVVCTASQLAMSADAWVQFTFRSNVSQPVPANASLYVLKTALEDMFTISAVSIWANELYDVGLTGVNSQPNATLCNPSANITIFIEFPAEHGNLPLLDVAASWSVDDSLALRVSKVLAGTTEDVECSGLGICDRSAGRCSCWKGYFSSNGSVLGAGETGDCSFRDPHFSKFVSVHSG